MYLLQKNRVTASRYWMLPTEQLIEFPENIHKIKYYGGGNYTCYHLIFVKVYFLFIDVAENYIRIFELRRELSRLQGRTSQFSRMNSILNYAHSHFRLVS